MKKFYLIAIIVFVTSNFSVINAQYLRGCFNIWGLTNQMTQSYGYYQTQFNTTVELTDCGFKLDQYGDWSLQWGYGTESFQPIVNGNYGQMRGSNSGDSPSDFVKTFEANKYYTFRIEGESHWWNRKFIIMETDNAPVEILTVSDNHSSAGTNPVEVSVTTSSTLSPQESIYVRYTTNLWSSSEIVLCSGSGTNYTANIPAFPAGTNVEYYVLSTAMPLSFVSQYPDFATLRGNNNAGSNYTYQVQSLSPYIVATPQEPLQELTLNNAIIDIEVFNDTWFDENFEISNFTFNNAPQGLSIETITYINTNKINIQLSFDGTDFSEDINNFSITIAAEEFTNSTNPLTTNQMTILAHNPKEDFYLAKIAMWEGGASDVWYDDFDFNEHNFGVLNQNNSLYLKSGQAFVWKVPGGDITAAKMFYRIYKQGSIPPAFTEQNLPWHSEYSANDTIYQLWWNSAPNETDLNILQGITESGVYIIEVKFEAENGSEEILHRDNNGAPFTAIFTYQLQATLSAIPTGTLNSGSLNGMQINLTLTNETFADNQLELSNFVLNNAPQNLTIQTVNYVSSTQAKIILSYAGTPISANIEDFSVTILGAELSGGNPLQSNNMTIFADVVHDGIYLAKVSMWEGGQNDTWYNETDFDGHDFGIFNGSMSLYLKSGQVFTWKDSEGDILWAKMNYRIYKEGETPGSFTQVDLPFHSEWTSPYGNTDQLWWNVAPNDINLNLLEDIEEGTYYIEVYYEAMNGNSDIHYRNNSGNNYIAQFTYTLNPVLIATPGQQLTEENLNGSVITLSLIDDFFADPNLEISNFTLNNAPTGLSIDQINYVTPTTAIITLSFDGTNFDQNINNFSITINGMELNSGISLTSNNMTIIAIDESITIWTHLLTNDFFVQNLGDNVHYWINMEIGQPEWNLAQIGYGTSAEGPETWTWTTAEWYEDGEGQNKKVHAQISVPQVVGTYYYAGRVRNTQYSQWFYANTATWTDSNVLAAQNTIQVSPLPTVQNFNANMLDGTRISLTWQADPFFPNVMIIAKAGSEITESPVQGQTYGVGTNIGDAVVIYKGSANSFIHTNLSNNTHYYYKIFTINNNYYSDFVAGDAETDDSEGCSFNIDLGNDQTICGGSSILLNPGLIVAPFGDTVTVYFNSAEFAGFSELNKVYMHAGVTLQGGSAWDYVVGNWGQDDGIGLMTKVSDNLWKITFNPLSYFGYNSTSVLLGINCVFRNADGSLIAKNPVTNEDFYVDLSINPPLTSYPAVTATKQASPITNITWSTGSHSSVISVSSSGLYWVSATDVYGCTGYAEININLFPLPYVEIGNDRTECVGNDIVLDAGNFENYLWNNGSTQQTINVTQSGLYSVTVTDSNGCTGFDVVNIELVEYPVADFNYSILTGTTVLFTDLSQHAVVYKWDFDNNGIVDSNVAGDVTYTYPQFGQYSAKLTVSNACSEVSVIKTILVVGIEELLNSTISIYPNPVTEVLFIKDLEKKYDILRIYDIAGRIIMEKNIQNLNNMSIDFTEIKSGIYNLELRNNEEIKSSRIIKN